MARLESFYNNQFNEYVAGVAKELASDLPQNLSNIKTSLPPPTIQLICLIPTSPFEIKKLLASLKPKSSSGIDEIPTTVLKTTPANKLHALTHAFNLSMLTLFSSTAGLLKHGLCKNVCNYFIVLDKILEFLDIY